MMSLFMYLQCYILKCSLCCYSMVNRWWITLNHTYMYNCRIECLLACCFTSKSRIFSLYGDVTIDNDWLQNLGLYYLWSYDLWERGIFIMPQLLWNETSVFAVSLKLPPRFSHNNKTISTKFKGCILTRIPMGPFLVSF